MKSNVLVGLTVDNFKGVKGSFLLNLIRRVGVEFAEVTSTIFEDIDQVISNMDGLKLGFHLPIISESGYDFSCLEKKKKIDALIENINRYWRKMNLQYVLAHSTEGHFIETPGECSEEFLFENLKKLEAPIVFENTLENENFNFDQFLERAESAFDDQLLGICFDPPHAYISREDWFPMLEKHYSKIRLLHLSDCTREEDLHQPFGQEGNLPVDEILGFLKDKGYKGMVNLELQPKSLSDLTSLFDSYLTVLRYLNRRKYFTMKLRSLVFFPLLKRRLK